MPGLYCPDAVGEQAKLTVTEWVETCRAAMTEAGLHFGHGTDNARDEAAWLVLYATGRPCDGSFTGWREALDPSQSQAVRDLLRRRIDSRRPLAYLLGHAWFCGLKFAVSDAVLVPRSPIAELIGRNFAPWVEARRLSRVLDLCTGSGCIAVAVAHHLPGVCVDAADISAPALRVAADNISTHGLCHRVSLVQSDLFAALDGRRYDLVVSNPPYVPEDALDQLPAEYRAEPRLGLAAGRDGLDLVLRILEQAPDHLAESGTLVCEVGESAGRLQKLLERVPFCWLEFEHGGTGVFTIGRPELLAARPALQAALANR